MNIAIIPARGGSKRIARKNIREFLGRPIIAYSIAAAKASQSFDMVVVSTDDEGIAEVARAHGAEAPFLRPSDLSDDQTGTNAVVRHAIKWLQDRGIVADYACCIYATAPFVQAKYLRQGLSQLVAAADKSFAFSVTSFPFPIQRGLWIRDGGAVEAIWPEHSTTRSQDLEHAFHDAGQFYWGRTRAFVEDAVLFSPASLAVVLPRFLVQDIDTEEDWLRAEYLFSALKLSGELDQG